ncbi:helix-turn-helix domain-containing protein [Neisseria sp. Ec49-e6-T10]|uniref:helix-turn-helix domain-containing protein n=1 Tax=Neisseria sp. Ec49-e6-T10 TaxID=3140744 RepID=UPI003EBB4BD0
MIRADIAIRLIEERSRLGYSQADFANKNNISREGLRLYESGQRGLPAEFLVTASELGLDVQYVLIGVRSKNLPCNDNQQTTQEIGNKIGGNVTNSVITSGSGNTINQINTDKHITKTIAKVEPNETHISEKMASTLQELVKEIVALENLLKKQPKTYQAVWSSLNRHCKVSQYRLIALSDYTKAEKYLRTWIGRLSSMKTAPKIDDEWRKRKYAYIKINTKHKEEWLKNLLITKYGVTSITELNDTNLQKVYNSVSTQKQKK